MSAPRCFSLTLEVIPSNVSKCVSFPHSTFLTFPGAPAIELNPSGDASTVFHSSDNLISIISAKCVHA